MIINEDWTPSPHSSYPSFYHSPLAWPFSLFEKWEGKCQHESIQGPCVSSNNVAISLCCPQVTFSLDARKRPLYFLSWRELQSSIWILKKGLHAFIMAAIVRCPNGSLNKWAHHVGWGLTAAPWVWIWQRHFAACHSLHYFSCHCKSTKARNAPKTYLKKERLLKCELKVICSF